MPGLALVTVASRAKLATLKFIVLAAALRLPIGQVLAFVPFILDGRIGMSITAITATLFPSRLALDEVLAVATR